MNLEELRYEQGRELRALTSCLAPYEAKEPLVFSYHFFSSWLIRTIAQVKRSGVNLTFTVAMVTK